MDDDTYPCGGPGHGATPEAEAERRRKIGEASRSRRYGPQSEEQRRKTSEALRGRKLPPETVAKFRAIQQARRDETGAKSRAMWERKWQELGQDGPSTYDARHRRVYKARGPARNQACVTCGKQAKHWAQIHGTTGYEPEHYQPMCQSCHFLYDEVAARAAATKRSKGRRPAMRLFWDELTPEQRSALVQKAWQGRSPEQRRAILQKAWETRRKKAMQ